MTEVTGGGVPGAATRPAPGPAVIPGVLVAPRRHAVAGLVGRLAPLAMAALAAAAVAVSFAPWLRTGDARRTSHEVVRAADRLGVLDAGPQAAVSVAWAFLPLVAVFAVLALVLERRRLAGALASIVGALAVALALVLENARRSADWGATAGLAIGSALVVAALATALSSRSEP
ncbi:MAG TPA: hypothetical protein VHK88_07455 [Aquihabitans sp.]|jgi:hypothetical protein|nr:hypothetical protein [Aquihabitans sp.]